MRNVVYNKLVRDKVPEVAVKAGQIPYYRKLASYEFLPELNKKLLEEVQEYLKTNNIEEIADILEVMAAILEVNNISREEIKGIMDRKAQERGKFKDMIYLESVDKPD